MGNSNIKTNYLYDLLNRILVIISPLIVTPYVTRVLGVREIGMFSYANTIANYFLMLAMMGISIYGCRVISVKKNSSRKDFCEAYSSIRVIQVINTIVFSILYGIYILFISNDNFDMMVVQYLLIISGLFDITWFMSGLEEFKNLAIRNITVNLLSIICIFLLVKSSEDIFIYATIKTGGILIGQLILWGRCKEIKEIPVIIPTHMIKNHYKQLIILFLPVATASIFQNMDRIMLGTMVSYSAVGLYYSSRMITDLPQCMITSINNILYPRLTVLISENNQENADRLSSISFFIINALSIGLCFGLCGIADNFVSIFFGPEYIMCSVYIPLLTPYIVLAAWNGTVRYQCILPMMRDKIYIKAITLGIVINLILNYISIPIYGVVGAIISTIVAEGFISIFQTIPIRKYIFFKQQVLDSIPLIISAGMMYGIIWGIAQLYPYNTVFSLVFKIIIGGSFYLLLIYIFLVVFKKADLQYLKGMR